MPVGPRGEKRPNSSVASMTMALKIATGQMEEQYVVDRPWTDEKLATRKIVETKKEQEEEGKEVSFKIDLVTYLG